MLARDFILFSLAVGGLIWFWTASLQAREQALTAGRRICREFDMQLLDATVALGGLGLGRDGNGRLCLLRRYDFEFSPDGDSRYNGRLYLHGLQVTSGQLDLPDGSTLVSPTGRRLDS